MAETRTPILIAGGGPVGLCLAMELGWHGVSFILVNERPGTATHPKGGTINSRSMEHMRRLGVASELRGTGLPLDHPTDSCYVTRLAGFEIGRLPMPSTREKMSDPGPWGETRLTPEPMHRCNQMYFEPIMRRHAESFDGTDIRFGRRLLSFDDEGDAVTATIEDVETGELETVVCDYLVGCDGGQSLVRKQLGFKYQGRSSSGDKFFDGRMLSIFVRAPEIVDALTMPIAWHYWTMNSERRVDVITLDGEGEYIMLAEIPVDIPLERIDADAIVRNTIGADTPFEVVSANEWTAGVALVTDHYQKGRVLLAGDAVHLFTPTGGFGFNTGIDDVANLGWKLAAVVNGWAPPHILDTYEVERRPIGVRNTSASGDYANTVGALKYPEYIDEDSDRGSGAREELRNYLETTFKEEFASMGIVLGSRYDDSPLIVSDGTSPPAGSRAKYTPSACPGGRAPHFWIDDRLSLYDQFGKGFTLLRIGDEAPETGAWESAAEEFGVPFKTYTLEDSRALDLYEAPLALIRPDQHVAWRGEGGDPSGILGQAAAIGRN